MATVRRVRRVIRKFDPWTVFKVSLIFHLVLTLGLLLGLLILWSVLVNVGIPDALDQFLALITVIDEGDSFFNNGQRFVRVVVFFAAIFSVAMTVLSTLAAVLYNLISDVVGGVEVVMLEETLRVPTPGGVRDPQMWNVPGALSLPDGQADLPTEAHDPLVDSDFFAEQPDLAAEQLDRQPSGQSVADAESEDVPG